MLPSLNPSTLTLYIVYAWFLGVCYGFVLISSAAGQTGEVNFFRPGETLLYQLNSTVRLNEKGDSSKNVGFYIAAEVLIQSVWGLPHNLDRIIRVEVKSPRLNIRSRKAPSPDGFIEHSSKLDEYRSKPFFLVWKNGKIENILLPKDEPLSLANLKKGIASLFQFQLLDVETKETDASGECSVDYRFLSPEVFKKIKTNCESEDLPFLKSRDMVLNTVVSSSRVATYEFDPGLDYLKSVDATETHQMYIAAKSDLGNQIETNQRLAYVKSNRNELVEGATIEEALQKVEVGEGIVFTHESLLTKNEKITNEEEKTLFNTINDVRENIKTKHLGSLVSAKSFIRLVRVARKSTKEDISKVLSSKKYQKILSQIYDVLGYVQTKDAHDTVMTKLHFDKEDHLDLSERYLWALSMASNPNPDIVRDLLSRHRKNDNFPEKIKETLILTIASMTHKLGTLESTSLTRKIRRDVEEVILNNLDYAKDDKRHVYLRALKNLKSPTTIPTLLTTIRTGTTKEGVLAFKALRSFDRSSWNSKVIQAARKSFLQLDRKYDSSSRTLAIDILLESSPSEETLHDFLQYLRSNDTSYEVKQYLFQHIQMIADEDDSYRDRILAIVKSDPSLNNYSVLSPRGLSTALKRNFLRSPSCNGSLLTVQEIFSGIVKRGIVNVVVGRNGKDKEIISLGIFAGGLSSFMSSGDSEEDEETATAGMELTVLGTQIRPFVFFSGQGELMGHVWSGTASDRTTAFQAVALLQDHLEYLRLGSGFIAELDLKGAMSFDLAGKIEISIWSRTADSLVEKSAGIVASGSAIIDTSFVRSQVEFTASIEPKLSLKSDIDFSSNVNLCMRVTQPDTIFRHSIFKIERIPGSKHKLRIAKYKKSLVPGTTYSLNRKNNEMCSAMFSS